MYNLRQSIFILFSSKDSWGEQIKLVVHVQTVIHRDEGKTLKFLTEQGQFNFFD